MDKQLVIKFMNRDLRDTTEHLAVKLTALTRGEQAVLISSKTYHAYKQNDQMIVTRRAGK